MKKYYFLLLGASAAFLLYAMLHSQPKIKKIKYDDFGEELCQNCCC